MTALKRHKSKRPPKPDRLLNPEADRQETRCYYATAPLDRLAVVMDRKWGQDRLPGLVSIEMADRYGAAMSYLNEAIRDRDPDRTAAAAQNCMRGLAAMDQAAEAAGALKASAEVLEFDLDGFRFAILPDADFWPTVREERPDLQVFTLREVAIALRAMRLNSDLVAAAKKLPGAEIVDIRPGLPASFYEDGGDPLPF